MQQHYNHRLPTSKKEMRKKKQKIERNNKKEKTENPNLNPFTSVR